MESIDAGFVRANGGRVELLENVQTARERARRGETVQHGEALAYLSDWFSTAADASDDDGCASSVDPAPQPASSPRSPLHGLGC